jgi:hypothetical protein
MNHSSVPLQLERISHRLAIVSTRLIAAGWALISMTGMTRSKTQAIEINFSLLLVCFMTLEFGE